MTTNILETNETDWDIKAGILRINRISGTPYVHQGRSLEEGFDCAGALFDVLQAAGWKAGYPDITYTLNYTPEGSWQDIKKVLDVEGYQIPREEAKVLDACVIQWRGHGIPQHFAVISAVIPVKEAPNYLWITHTHQSYEKVCTNRITGPMESRIYCYYRFRGRVKNDPLDPLNQQE